AGVEGDGRLVGGVAQDIGACIELQGGRAAYIDGSAGMDTGGQRAGAKDGRGHRVVLGPEEDSAGADDVKLAEQGQLARIIQLESASAGVQRGDTAAVLAEYEEVGVRTSGGGLRIETAGGDEGAAI